MTYTKHTQPYPTTPNGILKQNLLRMPTASKCNSRPELKPPLSYQGMGTGARESSKIEKKQEKDWVGRWASGRSLEFYMVRSRSGEEALKARRLHPLSRFRG